MYNFSHTNRPIFCSLQNNSFDGEVQLLFVT